MQFANALTECCWCSYFSLYFLFFSLLRVPSLATGKKSGKCKHNKRVASKTAWAVNVCQTTMSNTNTRAIWMVHLSSLSRRVHWPKVNFAFNIYRFVLFSVYKQNCANLPIVRCDLSLCAAIRAISSSNIWWQWLWPTINISQSMNAQRPPFDRCTVHLGLIKCEKWNIIVCCRFGRT